MAIIHDTTMDTTMSPGKLELLASCLPAQSWYLGILATADYVPGPRPGDH